jgi:hypothetical protein
MTKRHCPCCDANLPIKYFFKQMLFAQTHISFVEKQKGLLCPKCNHSILCAERKKKVLLPTMYFSIAPFGIFGITKSISFSQEYLFNFIGILILSISIFLLGVLKKYYIIEYICDDESSDEYNESSIQGG